MQYRRSLFRLKTNADGATAVEFAIVAAIFFFVMFVIIEFGMYMFARSVMESAITQASREASIASFPSTSYPGCSDRVCVAKTTLLQRAGGLSNASNINFTMGKLTDGAPFGGDYCSSPNGYCTSTNQTAAGSCASFVDINGNGQAFGCEGPSGASGGNAPGSTVQLRAVYMYRLFFPIPMIQTLFPGSSGGMIPIEVKTVIKNEL